MKSAARLLPALLAVVSLTVAAQGREGFGISYGPAIVSGSINCDSCNADSFIGAGGYLRLGRYLRPDLLVAVEASLQTLPLAYTRLDSSFLSTAMQWHPIPGSGIHVKGSLGVARLVDANNEDDLSRKSTLTAPSLGLSLGYDIGTSRGFLLTPFVTVTHLVNSDYKVNGQKAGSASATAFQLGLGFTWY